MSTCTGSMASRLYKICMDAGVRLSAKELEHAMDSIEKSSSINNVHRSDLEAIVAVSCSTTKPRNTKWLCNTGVKVDSIGLIMPVKTQPNKRIDGTAAAIMCYFAYNKYRTEFLQALR